MLVASPRLAGDDALPRRDLGRIAAAEREAVDDRAAAAGDAAAAAGRPPPGGKIIVSGIVVEIRAAPLSPIVPVTRFE